MAPPRRIGSKGRYCTKCGKYYLADQFMKYRRPDGSLRLRAPCRKCRLEAHFLKTYGMTLRDFSKMLKRQGGRCAICKRKKKSMVLDHNHEDGSVRGILCRRCNWVVGLIEKDDMKQLFLDYVS